MPTTAATWRRTSSTCCASPTTAGPRPAPGRVVRPRAGAGGGHRADQRRARPDRPGAAVAHACRAGSKAGAATRTRSRSRARPQFRNLTSRAAQRRLRRARSLRHFCSRLPARAVGGAGQSADAELAAIAVKAEKETRYHLQHSADWVIRLGDGTDESHARMQRRSTTSGRTPAELFTPIGRDARWPPRASAPTWSALEAPWRRRCGGARGSHADGAGARVPPRGKGVHTEHLGHLLAEMQYLQRAYPGGDLVSGASRR